MEDGLYDGKCLGVYVRVHVYLCVSGCMRQDKRTLLREDTVPCRKLVTLSFDFAVREACRSAAASMDGFLCW